MTVDKQKIAEILLETNRVIVLAFLGAFGLFVCLVLLTLLILILARGPYI